MAIRGKEMINLRLNQLIKYGLEKNILEVDDIYYAVNRLLNLLDLTSFTKVEVDFVDFKEIIEAIIDYALSQGILKTKTIDSVDAFEALITDCLLPRPSELDRLFYLHYKKGPLTATNFFYDLSVNTNYIKTERNEKNMKFKYNGKYAPLDITINLSKPEKDPLDIKSNTLDYADYPKCPLCLENVGLYQTPSGAPRTNHRVVSLTINHEKNQWGMHFSPYAYFNQHLIVLKKEHSPMYVNSRTFDELIDFVNKFPHYLIGSNAGLPIVGGSILNHHHFQGGKYDFPIEKALAIEKFKRGKVEVEVLNWPMAAIKIIGNNENKVLDLAKNIFDYWQRYENKDLNIFNSPEEIHNTVTPIVKLDGGNYNFYMIFRNNYCNEENPYGLFHINPSRFHIKKENIGLIEAMGMAILPGRLLKELEMIKRIIISKADIESFPELSKHSEWIKTIKQPEVTDLDAHMENDLGRIFEEALEDCNVFKFGDKKDFVNFINKAI